MEPLHVSDLLQHPQTHIESEPSDEFSEDHAEWTLEVLAPTPRAMALPAPSYSPALVAALSAAGALPIALLSEVRAETFGVMLSFAGASLLFGLLLGWRAARWLSGGLLAAASWIIGALGTGAMIATAPDPLLVCWADVGLIGIAAGAAAARGPAELPTAYWIAPARLLALLGALHAAVWLPEIFLGQSGLPMLMLQIPCALLAVAVAVTAGPYQRAGMWLSALCTPLAVLLVWPNPETSGLLVLALVALPGGLIAVRSR